MRAPDPISGRPLIGVTKPSRSDNLAYACIWAGIWLGGGKPVRITAAMPRKHLKLKGLVLGGGSDVFPGLYNEAPLPDYVYDRDRDEMEIAWAQRAERTGVPVLAICRGAQLMNVLRGGTLHHDINTLVDVPDYPDTLIGHVLYRKAILLEPGSLLQSILQGDRDSVNSLHKQAIADLGAGLSVSAREENGVVQGIEDRDRDYYLGVQFHPEFLIHRSRFRRIFRSFVEAARATVREASEMS